MDITIISTIIIAGVAAMIGVISNSYNQQKVQPFNGDKAEYKYARAMFLYCDTCGKQPEDLDENDYKIIWDYSCNHCSILLTWAIMRGYCGKDHLTDEPEAIEKVKRREMTGTEFFIKHCDCTLFRTDFAEDILPFIDAYYYTQYLDAYSKTAKLKLNKEPLTFAFSWEDYDVFEKIIDKAYRRWKFWAKPVIVSKR